MAGILFLFFGRGSVIIFAYGRRTGSGAMFDLFALPLRCYSRSRGPVFYRAHI